MASSLSGTSTHTHPKNPVKLRESKTHRHFFIMATATAAPAIRGRKPARTVREYQGWKISPGDNNLWDISNESDTFSGYVTIKEAQKAIRAKNRAA